MGTHNKSNCKNVFNYMQGRYRFAKQSEVDSIAHEEINKELDKDRVYTRSQAHGRLLGKKYGYKDGYSDNYIIGYMIRVDPDTTALVSPKECGCVECVIQENKGLSNE